MAQVLVELQTLPGFARQFDVVSVEYGLILHERVVSEGTSTRESVTFQPFVDAVGAFAESPGVSFDAARMAQERGNETPLDLALVRTSVARLDIAESAPFGRPALQRAFVCVLARGSAISPKLGLALHVRRGDALERIPCEGTGMPPLLLWAAPEWQAERMLPPPDVINDLQGYLLRLQGAADTAVWNRDAQREKEREREREEARQRVRDAERAKARERELAEAAERRQDAMRAAAAAAVARPVPPPAPRPAPPRPASPAPPPPVAAPPAAKPASGSGSSAGPGILVALLMAGLVWWWRHQTGEPAPAPPPPRPAPTAPASRAAPAPAPNTAPVIPDGVAQVTLERLYALGYDEHLQALNRLLTAARAGDPAGFDREVAWLSARRPSPTWPPAEEAARREFNRQIEVMVNTAKARDDRPELQRAVGLSQRFLVRHFGLVTAHMNLSIAHSALGQGEQALPPAFHAIVHNPQGANPYVVLALALARTNKLEDAAGAFCAALRRARYSEKTVAYFAKVARGEDLGYPGVAQAMQRTDTMCPRDRWGAD